MLAALRNRLSDLHGDDSEGAGSQRGEIIRTQAESACAFAAEVGCLIEDDQTFWELRGQFPELYMGAEHLITQVPEEGLVGKFTKPPAFGLVPIVKQLEIADLRAEGAEKRYRESIEFDHATPLEYLNRWSDANEVFGDDVRLRAVIRWRDGQVSFAITQPQYHGVPATASELERHFLASGWERVSNVQG